MDQRTRAYAASAVIVGIFLLVQLGALALVSPFESAGYQAVDDPQDPVNSLVYVVLILVMTAVMLAVIKFDVRWLLRLLLVGASAYLGLFVFRVLLPPVVTIPIGGFDLNALAWAAAGLLGVALWVYPEWYVVDAAGVVMGAGGGALFGISFGVLPAVVLLVVLAVYDAISVYGTEHMLTLASGVMDLKVPIVLVVPLSLSYSYLDAGVPDALGENEGEEVDEEVAGRGSNEPATAPADGAPAANGGPQPESDSPDGEASSPEAGEEAEPDPLDRNALFIGLGDAVIPTVLVASAAFFAPDSVPTVDLLGLSTALPAVTAIVGTILGLVVLLWMVLKGRAHAGLPLLNGGTIAGYLVGSLVSGLTVVQALGLEGYV